MDGIEYIMTIIGLLASIIGIYDFFIKNSKLPDIPSIEAKVKENNDHVVLVVKESDKNKLGTLSNIIYQYVEAYKPEESMIHYFIYNPHGHYLSSRSSYIQYLTGGFIFVIMALLVLLIKAFSDTQNISIIVLSFIFLILGIPLLYLSKKHYFKASIAEKYINFLRKNKISVGFGMLQKKSCFGKDFIETNLE